MFKWIKFVKTFLLIGSVLLCFSVISVKAQSIGVRAAFKGVAKATSKPRTPKSTPRRSTPRKSKVVVQTREVVRQIQVKTSNLTVASEPGAEVSLASALNGANPMVKKVPTKNPEDRTIEFENLAPGDYTVTVTLDGFQTQETDVTIPKQKTIGISLDLEPIKYNLTIETNIKEGEIRYASARYEGTTREGLIKTVETGGYCIVPIKNGEAVITELQKGYYNVDVRPKEVEYDPILAVINLPTDVLGEDEKEDESLSYSIDLEKKISTGVFSTSWANTDWNLPGGWSLSGRTMKSMGLEGIALPRNEQYRYYTNFEMISDVISNDGKSIGFIVRAVDLKNYYLIQISGANSPERFLASGFVVKEGVSTPLLTIPIEHFSKTIEQNNSFRVVIKGEDNVFKIFIEDSQTAKKYEVGNMVDRDFNFKKGAVGIAGRPNSKFVVGSFTVCAWECR